MSQITVADRLEQKTPEARLQHVLQEEFNLSLREAREVVSTAREILGVDRPGAVIHPGQIRMVVASLKAPAGPQLADTERVEVTLTVDAGVEDAQVLDQQGRVALRQGRILRLVDEALDQGGVLTEEDLARALQVTRRTVERDVKRLLAAKHVVQTRGQVKNTGRGQTHKVRIIELWLNRESYDRIALWAHHSPQAIKRYVSIFLRIAALVRQERSVEEIAFLVNASPGLIRSYLALYAQVLTDPNRLKKLEEELTRTAGLAEAAKKGAIQP